MKLCLEKKWEVFYNCYSSMFLGLEQIGVMFFKIEVVFSAKEKYNDQFTIMRSRLRNIELAEYVFMVSTANRLYIIFGVRPLFIRSILNIEFMIRYWFTISSFSFTTYSIEFLDNYISVINYFKKITFGGRFDFFTEEFFNFAYNRIYYPILYIGDTGDAFLPFKRKQYFLDKSIKNSFLFYNIPASQQESYGERTIIRIWALYYKANSLSIKGDKLISKDDKILGEYVGYLVGNFFIICDHLKDTHFSFSFIGLNTRELYVKYMKFAEEALCKDVSLLFFDEYREDLSLEVSK